MLPKLGLDLALHRKHTRQHATSAEQDHLAEITELLHRQQILLQKISVQHMLPHAGQIRHIICEHEMLALHI